MVEGGSKVMDGITGDAGYSLYQGLVSFNKSGALTGLYICLDNVREGRILAKNLVNLVDVFRCPVNF